MILNAQLRPGQAPFKQKARSTSYDLLKYVEQKIILLIKIGQPGEFLKVDVCVSSPVLNIVKENKPVKIVFSSRRLNKRSE